MPDSVEDRIRNYLYYWDTSADHRTGTKGDNLSAAWLCDQINSAGLVANRQQFPFRRRTVQSAQLRIDGKQIKGVPLFDAPDTPVGGFEGKLALAGRNVDGPCIGVCSHVTGAPGAGSPSLSNAREDPKYLGLIVVSAPPESGIALINADRYGSEYGPPTLQVDQSEAGLLEDATKSRAIASMNIRFHVDDVHASNVQATILGQEPHLAPIVVMTPKSSWWTCTAERGGGLVLWLEAMHHFAEVKPRRTLIFTANSGHELGHVGLDQYIAQEPDLVSGATIWIHLGANFAANGSSIRVQASSRKLMRRIERLIPHETQTEIGTRPGGEARNIYDGGGRYVSILGSNSLFHHPNDRLNNNVDLTKLLTLRENFLELCESLLTDDELYVG